MQETIDRLPELIKLRKEIIDRRISNNQEIDYSAVLAYRFLAVAEYIISKDPNIFFRNILRASEILVELARRGENIAESNFVEVFIPLAIGKADLTIEFMCFLSKIKLNIRTRDYSTYFHLCFQKFILGRKVDYFSDDMIAYFKDRHKGRLGYAICFKALEKKEVKNFEEGIKVIMKNHKRVAASSFVLGLADQLIALWPLGMVNLARLSGMDVQVNHPLIPQDLIVPCQENQFAN